MSFLELLKALELRLGNQHLPLNPRATTIKHIFEGSPVHHELMHRLVQAIYYANGCERLSDSVEKGACFDAIGPVRQDALRISATDVDVYRLLDDFCHSLDDIFATALAPSTDAGGKQKPPAQVIGIDSARRRPKSKS